jgi:hypothetical protein
MAISFFLQMDSQIIIEMGPYKFQKISIDELNALRSKHIKVVNKHGDVVYDGPLMKTLIYNGLSYPDHMLFAEPQVINDVEYQLINTARMIWCTGTPDHAGYTVYIILNSGIQYAVRRGTAMLETFIGPPPEASWTCNHLHVDESLDRIQIRTDDLLDRIEWASKTTQVIDRIMPKDTSHSKALVGTHSETGEVRRFSGILAFSKYTKCDKKQARDAIINNQLMHGWSVKYDVLTSYDGEIWINLGNDNKRRISSFGRIAHVTITNELVEWQSCRTDNYREIMVDGTKHKISHLMINMFGTEDDRKLLATEGFGVVHMDRNKHNDNIKNLRVMNTKQRCSLMFGKPVRVINDNGDMSEFGTITDAAEYLKVGPDLLIHYLKGRHEAKRFKIEYIE